MKNMNNQKGETLIESLCALTILALIMMGLPILISNINQLNAVLKETDQAFSSETAKEEVKGFVLKIVDESRNTTYTYDSDELVAYINEEDYFYYEAK